MTAPMTILFGDSITEGVGAGLGWFSYGNTAGGNKLAFLRNAGIGGNTTAAMLARIQTDVLAYTAPWVIVEGGGNDIVQGRTSAAIIADLSAIWTTLLADGRKLIVSTVLPTTSIDTPSERTVISEVNAWIRGNVPADAYLCDWNPAMSEGNEWTPKAGLTSDGVHPNDAGHQVMGGVLGPVIQVAVP